MPKIKELIQPPPEPEGNEEHQISALRDYLVKITQELHYLLTHLEVDNINDSTFQKISEMIPRPYVGQPLPDGDPSPGQSSHWARGDHRHGHDSTKAEVTALAAAKEELEDALELEADAREAHEADKTNPHEVTKAQVGLGNVADERQYSALNPPPIPTPAQVGAIPATEKGSAGGVAELDSNGMVPSAQLPSYVDDVLNYPTLADFPAIGEDGKIYVAKDTNRQYRWSGSDYVEISKSLALGETSSTAYRGDRGKIAYDHSQNPYTGTPEMDGAGSAGSSTAWARGDHVHPTDTSRAAASLEINGHPLTGDFDLDAIDVGARPSTWTPSKSDIGLGNVENERQYSTQNPPPYPVTSVNGSTGAVSLDAADVGARTDDWVPAAEDVPYDNTQSGLMATDVQAAIDELAQGGGGGGTAASAVSYDNAGSGLAATNVQDAIDEVYGDIPVQASDIGALPEDGTAVNAGTLSVAHTITGDVGWYKFFEETVNAGLSRNYIFLITDTYTSKDGIISVFITRNTGGTTTVVVRVLDGTIPASFLRWEYTDKLYLYIQKESNPSGRIQFRVLTNAARTGNPVDLSTMWKNEAVSEPTGANNATADVLQYTAQVVSAGTNQQILSISNPSITEDHVLARIEFADPKYITETYSWTTADGSFTLTGTATAATTANILLVRKGN